MEPTNLNSPADEDAVLRAIAHAGAPELADEGFSHRVLAALPAPRPNRANRPARWPWIAYLGGGLVGAGCALAMIANQIDLAPAGRQLGNALLALGGALADPWLASALGMTALALAIAAFFAEPRRRWLW